MFKVIFAATLVFCSSAFGSEFSKPWEDSKAVLVIDPYYGNNINWDKLKGEARIAAVIHKSTIGTSEIDKEYFSRRDEAKKRGYLWGSYHWGVSGNPERQADHYIDTVKPSTDELIALDLEDAKSSTLMNAQEALLFIKQIKKRTSRYPVIYTNHASAVLLSKNFKNTEFAQCPIWYARFKEVVTDFPKGIWESYTLWQFSSEIKPQIVVPGVKSDMYINVYNGNIQSFKTQWPFTK